MAADEDIAAVVPPPPKGPVSPYRSRCSAVSTLRGCPLQRAFVCVCRWAERGGADENGSATKLTSAEKMELA